MGWGVVVVDIQLSIHIENLYYIVNGVERRGRGYTIISILSIHIENLYYIVNGVGRRGRGYTTIYTHREPILHSQWVERRGRGYTTIYTHREPILHSQWGGASWSWIYNYLYT